MGKNTFTTVKGKKAFGGKNPAAKPGLSGKEQPRKALFPPKKKGK